MEITDILGVHKSAISRILQRNQGDWSFGPKQPRLLKEGRRQVSHRPRIPDTFWECAQNKNINGLIVQYFPKGMDFNAIIQKQLNRVMDKLAH